MELPAITRTQAEQAAQQSFAFAIDIIRQETDEAIQQYHLKALANDAARLDLWDVFARQYGTEAAEELITIETTEDVSYWATAFAAGGNTQRVQLYAETITNDQARITVYRNAAHSAAESAQAETAQAIAESVFADSQTEQSHIATFLFATYADRLDWEAADAVDWSPVDPDVLLHGSGKAASAGDLTRFKEYASRALNTYAREDLDENDKYEITELYTEALTHVITRAFYDGDIMTLMDVTAGLPLLPFIDRQEIIMLQRECEMHAINNTQNYATGVQIMIAHAKENEHTDKQAYALLEEALQIQHWDAIQLVASRLNPETIGMLVNLALQENQPEASAALNDQLQDMLPDRANENVLFPIAASAPDTTPAMFDSAKRGDWETALDLLHRLPTFFVSENMAVLAETAINQGRIDMLAAVTAHATQNSDEAATQRALQLLEERGETEATTILKDVLKEQHGVVSFLRDKSGIRDLWIAADRARIAARNGNWPRAEQTIALSRAGLDVYMEEFGTGDTRSHRGRQNFRAPREVALEALKIVAAVRHSEALEKAIS